MAYAYDAYYGYYVDTQSTGHSRPSLVGLNISDLTLSTGKTLFIVPETLLYPQYSGSQVTLEEAMQTVVTLTEYPYICTVPYIPYEADFTTARADEQFREFEKFIAGAFFYSRPLIHRCEILHASSYDTFVYLPDNGVIITSNGVFLRVNPTTGVISSIFTGDNFKSNFLTGNMNPQPSQHRYSWDCAAQIPFIYDGKWYTARITISGADNYDTGDRISTAYTLYSGRTESAKQDLLNQYLIGTPENPKYKYKTDPADPDTDPYIPPFSPSKPSDKGGGDGTHDPNPENDPAPIPDITQMTSILDTDFMTAYKMTAGGLKNLGAFLWSQNFYGVIANVLNSPFDVIIGLHIVPVNPSVESNARAILLGNVDSNIAGYRVTSQYVEKDLGGFDVPHIWGAYLDYQGKFEIFLPFIGFRSIAADDIVGHQIRVKYHIDVVTGACIAYILTDNYVTYTFAGSCSYNIPVTGQNFSNIVSSMIQTAGTIGMAAIAPEGMGAAGAMAAAGSALNTAMSKPTYSRSGGMGGNNAFMGMRTPVLIARVPNIAIPGNQNKIVGYPSFITRTLSEVHGYTEVYKVHLEGIGASDTEKSEIETALMEGVIL